MGAMTLVQMEDDVRYVVGGYTTTELSNTLVDRWLRWSLLHVGRPGIYEHRELFTSGTVTMATNDRDYGFTTFGTTNDNVQAVSLVVNESRGQRFGRMSLRQFEESSRLGTGAFQQGRPSHYMIAGTNLYVYPAPSATYNGDTVRVWFWRKPAALAASPAHELAEDWDEVIVAGATWRAFRYLNLQDRAEIAKAEFGQLVNEVGDRLRADMREDMSDSRMELELDDYQSHSF